MKLVTQQLHSPDRLCVFRLKMSLRIVARRGATILKAGNVSALSNGSPSRNAAQARAASTSTNLPEDVKHEIYVRTSLSLSVFGGQLTDELLHSEMHNYQTQILRLIPSLLPS